MARLQGTAAVQAFIAGCLATKKFPISAQFRSRLQEVLSLLDQEKTPVMYFSHKELDEIIKINIFVQQQKTSGQTYPDFFNCCNDFLKFVFRIKAEDDFEQLFSFDFLLGKEFKGYIGFVFCDVVKLDYYDMKDVSILSLDYATRLAYLAREEAKNIFKKHTDQSLSNFALFLIDIARKTRLDHPLVLLRLMLNFQLNNYKFFKNEKIVKKLIESNQELNKAYNQHRLLSFDYYDISFK